MFRIILVAIFTVMTISNVYAQSVAERLLSKFNKEGYFLEPRRGRKIECPCELIGFQSEGKKHLVFISTKKHWWSFTCYDIEGAQAKGLCTFGQKLNSAWSFW